MAANIQPEHVNNSNQTEMNLVSVMAFIHHKMPKDDSFNLIMSILTVADWPTNKNAVEAKAIVWG